MEIPSLGDQFDGFLNESDNVGTDLQIAVNDKQGKLMISFSRPMTWLALNPPEAMALAHAIIHRAVEMQKKQ